MEAEKGSGGAWGVVFCAAEDTRKMIPLSRDSRVVKCDLGQVT